MQEMPCRLALCVVLAMLPRIAAAGPMKIAVVPGAAVNLDSARVDALAQELADALHAALEVDAIGGLEVRRRLPEQLPPDCVVTQSCIDDVARRLGTQQLLFVVMIDTGTNGALRVDATWVDGVQGKVAARPSISIAAIGNARLRFEDAAPQLLPDVPVRRKPTGNVVQLTVPRHFSAASYATMGATLVGVSVGVVFGLSTRSRYKDCEALGAMSQPCPTGATDGIRSRAAIADVGWLVAVGGAIATSVLYVTSGNSPGVVVEPTAGGVAVMAVGRFR